MTPRIQVIVVTYRSRQHVPSCLDALPAAADDVPWDLFVVDNASDDGTMEWLRGRVGAERLLGNEENRGFAAAVNQAAARSEDDLLLLNPDAVLEPRALARLVRELQADAAIGAAGPQLLNRDGSPQASAWLLPGAATLAFDALMMHNAFPRARWHRWRTAGGAAEDVPSLSGACLLVRRACWRRLQGLDERFFLYYEDIDFCARARAAGYRLRLVPEARCQHALGGSAFQDRRRFVLHFHESRRRYLHKHHPGLRGRLLVAVDVFGLAVRALAHALRGRLGRRPEFTASAADHRAALRAWRTGEAR
jgi:GT2 family glycosyltransferase